MSDALPAALAQILTWETLTVILLSAAYGVFVGAIPGLTATMAVALMVPITFFLDDTAAIAAIVTTVTCSIFAGDIPGALVRIPGTPASAAYALDAYALTKQGLAERALGVSLVFSVVGGLFGVGVLYLAAGQLARLDFISYEYFWLCVLGLSCAAIVSHGSRLKGTFALLIGLLLSTIGLSTDHGAPRLTFGYDELYAGVNFIPAMIGLFGVSEVFRNVLSLRRGGATEATVQPSEPSPGGFFRQQVWRPLANILGGMVPFMWRRKFGLLRSSAIGSFVGMLPGAGADLAAWIAYAASKRFSSNPEGYGHGSIEGLGDATSANNSALASAWIPSLVFGIPGDSVTAIALGVLLMKNIEPGPKIFTDPKQSALVYSVYLTFIVANIVLIPLGLLAIRAGSLLVRAPRGVLLPIILVFCMLGAYAIGASYFDIWVMLAMGLLGFVLEGLSVPLGPVVLGIILGGQLEHRFLQSLANSDSWLDFFTRPVSTILALICLALWLAPLVAHFIRRRRHRRSA